MNFTKMHGCGNDYVYVDCTKGMIENPGEISRKVRSEERRVGKEC